jgi:deoxyadenosine/deoxycytidine kinase
MLIPLVISVEGNIGSGKTTILEKLEEHCRNSNQPNRILFLREPLDVWEGVKDPQTGENILEKFYANPEKYSFPFQVMAFSTRLALLQDAVRDCPDYVSAVVIERSLAADKQIFAKMLHDDGKIDDISYQIYENFHKTLCRDVELNGIVYIDADADVCKARVEKRSRQGESEISLEYLQKCKKYHDEWMDKEPDALRIKTNQDVTYDMSDETDQGNVWIKQILDYIDEAIKTEEELN